MIKEAEETALLIITSFLYKSEGGRKMSQSRSPQEIRIQNEINHKKIANVHENRATEILKKVRESKPQIDIERGLYFTKSFRKRKDSH